MAERAARLGWTPRRALVALAVGCPTCNHLLVLALCAGALTWFEPLQPIMGVASLGVLAWAPRARRRAAPTQDAPAARVAPGSLPQIGPRAARHADDPGHTLPRVVRRIIHLYCCRVRAAMHRFRGRCVGVALAALATLATVTGCGDADASDAQSSPSAPTLVSPSTVPITPTTSPEPTTSATPTTSQVGEQLGVLSAQGADSGGTAIGVEIPLATPSVTVTQPVQGKPILGFTWIGTPGAISGDPAWLRDAAAKLAARPLTLGTFVRPPATPGAVTRSGAAPFADLVLLGGTLLRIGDIADGNGVLEPVPREAASGGIYVDASDLPLWLEAARRAPELTVLYQRFAPVRRSNLVNFPAGPCLWVERIDSASVSVMSVTAAWDGSGTPMSCPDARARLGLGVRDD